MADFSIALERTLKFEGSYLHHILVNIGKGKIHPSFAKELAERAIQ